MKFQQQSLEANSILSLPDTPGHETFVAEMHWQTTQCLIKASNLRSERHFINGKPVILFRPVFPDLSCNFNIWPPREFHDGRFDYCSLMALRSRF